MKTLTSHKNQAFILTCLIFSPLLLLFLGNALKIETKGQDSISLAMQQFVAQGEFVSSKLNPIQGPHKHKHKKKHKKEMKTDVKKESFKPQKEEQEKQILGGGAQVANATPTQIGTLAYGKTDNPFLREIKIALDKAVRDTYPQQAIKMRLTGIVWLEFIWLKSKELKEVRILKSSGYKILDENILKALAKASNEFPAYKENVRIQLPFHYNLKCKHCQH